jgi:hypothetical protein
MRPAASILAEIRLQGEAGPANFVMAPVAKRISNSHLSPGRRTPRSPS